MTCEETRFALSALLDGETPAIPVETARRHLAGCADCRRWQARAEQLNRLVRVQPADQVPDLTERVLAAVHAERAAASAADRRVSQAAAGGSPGRARWRLALRVGLAFVALLQLAFAVWDLLATHGVHAGQEEASFDIAVAVGFLLAAPYPDRARALLPVAGILAAALLVTTGIDVVNGATTLSHELVHGLAGLEALLLWLLGRTGRRAAAPDVHPVTA